MMRMLQERVTYNRATDELEGVVDSGQFANHASVFMIKSLSANWKQPIGYFVTSGTMAPKILKEKISECISRLLDVGLDPLVFVCDQGSNNRSAMKQLGVNVEKPWFSVNGKKMYALYDAPHLLKNIRTNLKRHRFSSSQKLYTWQHIEQLYAYDSAKKIRMVPKLTQKHIALPPFTTMSVPLAVKVQHPH